MRRVVFALLCTTLASPALSATHDETILPGVNDDKAEFRLWLPDASGPVRALVILVPGSNGDGRGQVACDSKPPVIAGRTFDSPN